MRHEFIYNGMNSRDYVLRISGEDTWTRPQPYISRIAVPGRNGDLIQLGHCFQNVDITYVALTFHVKGISRACLAQLSRHRHISLSVRSQRYCREDDFDYVNPFSKNDPQMYELYDGVAHANEVYQSLVEGGAKPEDARMVLPNACCTELYLTANARTLIEISHLRLCTRAQREIRELFQNIKQLLNGFCPEVAERMVPTCENYPQVKFCTERTGCGRHPSFRKY